MEAFKVGNFVPSFSQQRADDDEDEENQLKVFQLLFMTAAHTHTRVRSEFEASKFHSPAVNLWRWCNVINAKLFPSPLFLFTATGTQKTSDQKMKKRNKKKEKLFPSIDFLSTFGRQKKKKKDFHFALLCNFYPNFFLSSLCCCQELYHSPLLLPVFLLAIQPSTPWLSIILSPISLGPFESLRTQANWILGSHKMLRRC